MISVSGQRLNYIATGSRIALQMLHDDMNAQISASLGVRDPYRNMTQVHVAALYKAVWDQQTCVIGGQTRTAKYISNAYLDARDILLEFQSDTEAAVAFDSAAMAIILSRAGSPPHVIGWATLLYQAATRIILKTEVIATRTRLAEEYQSTLNTCGF